MHCNAFDENMGKIFKIVTLLILASAVTHGISTIVFGDGRDFIFIVCLLINTILFIQVLKVSQNILASDATNYDRKEIFNTTHMLYFGIFYGAAFGISPFVFPFDGVIYLKCSVALFLLCHNFLTGLCVLPLARFYILVFKFQKHLKIELWDRSNPELKVHFDLFKTLIIYISFVCPIALTAAMFSYFSFGFSIWVFSLICAVFMLSVYLIPQIPVALNFRKNKKSKIDEINQMIQKEYQAQIEKIKKGDQSDIQSLDHLKYLRSLVNDTGVHFSSIPKRIITVISVFGMPMIPVILEKVVSVIIDRYKISLFS